jgi:hypothetical protein
MNLQALREIFQNKFGTTLSEQELLALAGGTDASGRSPLRPRQLTDLRLAPRADDPRPTFFTTSEVPRDWDTTGQHEFPKLMWSPKGQEITIPAGRDAKAHEAEYEAKGYGHIPPASEAPMDAVQREMAQLSDEDRKLVLEMQQQARMNRLQERMSHLTDQELASVLVDVAATPAKGKKSA